MSPEIESTYEISKEIGSGGGGIVYLGRHTRLDKTIVLKADKRPLTTKADVLRREVDALKNLNHSYKTKKPAQPIRLWIISKAKT